MAVQTVCTLPPVLIPRLHLSLRQMKSFSHFRSVCNAQVFLTSELPFQKLELRMRECRSASSRFLLPSSSWRWKATNRLFLTCVFIVFLDD